MVDHIYGRTNIVTNSKRPHVFIKELQLYIDFLTEQLKQDFNTEQFDKRKKYFTSFYQNLMEGISYYRQLKGIESRSGVLLGKSLDKAELELASLNYQYEIERQNLVC